MACSQTCTRAACGASAPRKRVGDESERDERGEETATARMTTCAVWRATLVGEVEECGRYGHNRRNPERPTSNMAFENLCSSIAELHKILPMYHAIFTDHESTKGIVSMIDMEAMRARPTNMQPSPVDSGMMPQVGMQSGYTMYPMAEVIPPAHRLSSIQGKPKGILAASSNTAKAAKMKAPEKPKVPRQRRTSKAVPPTTHVAPASVSEPSPSPAQATPSPSKNRLKTPREKEAMVQSTITVVPRNVASDEVPSKRMKGELAEAPEAELPN
ncbi:hypothetical protein DFH11DRAFT_1878838 [Phellopilus nigrolimitatus]|nr:hypothetical protein DFH11DRAFT_1878838 [Phellopilus nigrolimitatus]